MQFFAGKWSRQLLQKDVHISVLEAWTTVMIDFTWGHLWSGRKVIVRTDSKHGCACLNRLWSKTESMAILCDLWEDIQFHFGVEALIVFCSGKTNVCADAASRVAKDKVEDVLRRDMATSDVTVRSFKEIPVEWTRGDLSCDVGALLR